MNTVENMKLKVWSQVKGKKKDKDVVLMDTSFSGQRNADGTYGKSIKVKIVVDENTNWLPSNYKDLNVLVSGRMVFSDVLYIFATNLTEYVYSKDMNKKEETSKGTQTYEKEEESEWKTLEDDSELPFK